MPTIEEITTSITEYGTDLYNQGYAQGQSDQSADDQVIIDQLNARIAELEGEIPPEDAATLWGTTGSTALTGQKMFRTYDNGAGPRLWANTAAKQFTDQGIPVCDSCHPNKNAADPGWSATQAKQDAVAAWVGSVPDMPGIRLCVTHEPEYGNQYGSTGAAQYVTDQNVFSGIVRAANQSRQNPIIIVRCFGGYNIERKDMSPWLQGDFDELGSDIYNLDQVTPSFDLAAQFSVPLCVPECGNGTTTGKTDAQVSAFMTQLVPTLKDKATWVTWFDSGFNDLADRPVSSATWQAVLSDQ